MHGVARRYTFLTYNHKTFGQMVEGAVFVSVGFGYSS